MQLQLIGDFGAGLGADQLIEAHRELTLRRCTEGLEQQLGDAQAENPVAEKFQPLVVAGFVRCGRWHASVPIRGAPSRRIRGLLRLQA